ncbi:MAG: ROK family transcriptional regulator [Clostridia bacterium]|nr:ROK family transcriptional regulator [Clostridia bacterium]
MTTQVANVQLMQKMNRLKVLNYVRRHPDCSRPEIARETGLSLASITNITAYLLDIGILSDNGTETVGRVGRKSTLLRFTSDAYNLICVFLSKDYINIYVTDLTGTPTRKVRHSTENLSSEKVIALIVESLSSLTKEIDKENILGIGVSISGLVLESSRFIFSSKFKWKAFDIKSILEESTQIPVFVDNISPVRATWHLNENTSENKDNILFIDLENGIGAAWFSGGQINTSVLGEIGHTTVKKDGEPCFCGNRGCLESMCSEKRLLSLFESSSGKRLSELSSLQSLYDDGSKPAVFAIEECGKYLGIGLANLVNLFNPSKLIINTGDFTNCPSLLSVAKEEISKRAFPVLTDSLEIECVTSNDDTTIRGMAYNLCDRLFDIACPHNIID